MNAGRVAPISACVFSFNPILHTRGKQGFKVGNGLLYFSLLMFYLLYAMSKELLEREGRERNGEIRNCLTVSSRHFCSFGCCNVIRPSEGHNPLAHLFQFEISLDLLQNIVENVCVEHAAKQFDHHVGPGGKRDLKVAKE